MEDELAFQVVGAVRYSPLRPAFALAVLTRRGDNRLWLQVRGESQKITGFVPVDDLSPGEIVQQTSIPVEVGQEYVHAFVDRQEQLYLDTAASLRTVLSVTFNHPETPLCTKIAIAEQLNFSRGDQIELQRDLAISFEKTFGVSTAMGYKSSLVRQRYWDLLEARASTPEAAAKIARNKAHILAQVLDDGTIVTDASTIDPQDLIGGIAEVDEQLGAEFGKSLARRGPPPKLDLSQLRFANNPNPAVILNAVQSSGRQEERLAVLIRAALVHPEAGAEAIHRHHDRAAFARDAVQNLRGKLGRQLSDKQREIVIASAIREMYANCYPFGRGKLLYYLASHLYDFPLTNDTIRKLMNDTTAEAVERYREDITDMLGRPATNP